MLRTISTSVCLILLKLSFSGCGSIPVYDHELCGDKGELGASCFRLLSDGSRKLDFEAWQDERFGQICMTAEAFANLKTALLKLCDQTKRCDWQQVEAIKDFGKRVNNFKKEKKVKIQ